MLSSLIVTRFFFKSKSKNEVRDSASGLGCSRTEYLLGVEVFCRSLESVARSLEHDGGSSMIDLTHAHHWTQPADATREQPGVSMCGCGALESSEIEKWTYLNAQRAEFSPAVSLRDAFALPRVLDSFTAKLNALQVAVETANLALDVRYVVQDVN